MVDFTDQIITILDDITTISGLKRSIYSFLKKLKVEYMSRHYYDNLGLALLVYDFDLDYAKAFSINYLRKLLLLLDESSSIITLEALVEKTKIDLERIDVLRLPKELFEGINDFPEPDIFIGNPLANLEFDKIVIPQQAVKVIYIEGAAIQFEIDGKSITVSEPLWDDMENIVRGQE